jgi:signal recognition particle GTPase
MINMKAGLYSNINTKRKRIAAGSGEKMNKVGSKNAPTAKDFKQAAKTAKPMKAKKK